MGFEFEVIGDIKGKARPRVNTYTCKAYTPENTKDYEMLIKQYFKLKYPRYVPLENRVSVKIVAQFKIPKTATKKDKELIMEGKLSPTKKPDIDNIVKIILDALNKMAFKDDNQITKIEVEKIYGNEEKIYVKIEEY
ncbi:MAG: RusA family crossover junction endodeoxyribonuclease [Clostridia bacterium]|nr:RusA family crossover junction endodeoxyribonuclease [Clostridia bacterium]